MTEARPDELDLTFAALADPTRRAILSRLADGEATVNELAEPFPISLQAVSRHVRVLERAGLITQRRQAQYRPCQLQMASLDPVVDWLAAHRQHWEERLGRLEEHLRTIQTKQNRTSESDPQNHDQEQQP